MVENLAVRDRAFGTCSAFGRCAFGSAFVGVFSEARVRPGHSGDPTPEGDEWVDMEEVGIKIEATKQEIESQIDQIEESRRQDVRAV